MLPGTAGKPHLHYETIRRWTTDGLHGVKLKTRPLGGRRVLEWEWIEEFMDNLAAAEVAADEVPQTRRQSEDDRAESRVMDRKSYFME